MSLFWDHLTFKGVKATMRRRIVKVYFITVNWPRKKSNRKKSKSINAVLDQQQV
jgi:hypothetical protein